MKWQTTEPPKTGNTLLADIGYPWPVVIAWCAYDQDWVYANLQINMIGGEYCDPYFETERHPEAGIKRWMPLPGLD